MEALLASAGSAAVKQGVFTMSVTHSCRSSRVIAAMREGGTSMRSP